MGKYIQRDLEQPILAALEKSFIVAILGTRQVGKTTLMGRLREHLARDGFPKERIFFFNLDDVLLRQQIAADFYFVLNQLEQQLNQKLTDLQETVFLFIDEAQKVPDIFELVKIIHDQHKNKVKIVLSGSSSLSIQKKSAESLAGRIVHFHLFPLSISEIMRYRFSFTPQTRLLPQLLSGQISFSRLKKQQAEIVSGWERQRELKLLLDQLLLNGSLPAVWQNPSQKTLVFKSLAETYLEKDIRALAEVGSLEDFTHLLRLFSFEIGGIYNQRKLSRAAGIAVNTLKKYRSVLLATFIINRLSPLVAPRKQLVKSPKMYFFDVGLANFLAGREKLEHIKGAKAGGALFENILLKSLESCSKNLSGPDKLAFWRDYQGHEIDLVIDLGGEKLPVEITLGKTLSNRKKRNLKRFFKEFDNQVKHGLVVYAGPLEQLEIEGKSTFLVPWWMWW